MNSTRLKEKLLASLPGLSAHAKGREVLLVFDDDVGQILSEGLCRDQESKMKCLTRAAEIVREDMFKSGDLFNGSFQQGCQESSVSPLLLRLVDMVLQGSNEIFHHH